MNELQGSTFCAVALGHTLSSPRLSTRNKVLLVKIPLTLSILHEQVMPRGSHILYCKDEIAGLVDENLLLQCFGLCEITELSLDICTSCRINKNENTLPNITFLH